MIALWDFACQLYDQEGVSSALLTLQDEQNLNIPMLLFCLWRGCYVGVLTEDELASAQAAADTRMVHLVLPARRLRRQLQTSQGKDSTVYRLQLEQELALERRLLAELELGWGRPDAVCPTGAQQAIANARAYLAAAGIVPSAENDKKLAVVFRHLPA